MNFDFSDEQHMLRDEVRKFLVKESPLKVSRELMLEQGLTHSGPVWLGLAGLGATALMLPDDCGGADLGAMELCVVAEELGRQLSPVPLASTLYLAAQAVLLGAPPRSSSAGCSPVAEGAIGAFAAPLDGGIDAAALPRFDGECLTGIVPLVADGGCATWAVVLAADGQERPVWVVRGLERGLVRRALATLDPVKPFAHWRFEATPAEALAAVPDATALLQRVRNRAAVLLAFEQLGAADAALEMAAACARERGLRPHDRLLPGHQAQAGRPLQRQPARPRPLLLRCVGDHGRCGRAGRRARTRRCRRLGKGERHAAAFAGRTRACTCTAAWATRGRWTATCSCAARASRRCCSGTSTQWREQLAAALEARLAAPAAAAPAASRPAAETGSMDFDDSPAEATFRAECRAWLSANARPKPRADALFGPDLTPAPAHAGRARLAGAQGARRLRRHHLAAGRRRPRRHADPGADLAPGGRAFRRAHRHLQRQPGHGDAVGAGARLRRGAWQRTSRRRSAASTCGASC
jgi:alkylation response protein AidB-like acyl-CoA dehydrogenase